jgi:hypothetical protein
MLKKFPPTKKKNLIYINLTPAEEEKNKQKKWFAPPDIWQLDFYIGRLEDQILYLQNGFGTLNLLTPKTFCGADNTKQK